jgi:hypothetical protein
VIAPPPSPSRAYWLVCGSPHVELETDAPEGARCAICADELRGRGVPLARSPVSFCNQTNTRIPASPWLCVPCLFATRWIAPPGRSGKGDSDDGGRGPNPAMYGHRWEQLADGTVRYGNHSKGDKAELRAWLRAPKAGWWWCTIADSGKKHTIPWAPINHGSSAQAAVLFDEVMITVGDHTMVDDISALLTSGATKASVESGRYTTGEYERCAEHIAAFEDRWGAQRGCGWFGLAVWLAQRDEAAVAARLDEERAAKAAKKQAERERAKADKPAKTKTTKAPRAARSKSDDRREAEGNAADADGGADARPAQPVPAHAGVQRADALGAAHDEDASVRPDVGERRRVGDDDAAPPSDTGPEQVQLGLFADAEPRGARARRRK